MSSAASSSSSDMVPVAAGSSSSSVANQSSSGSSNTYMLNSRIMVVAVAVLFGVVLFILCIHIYAKWFWRNHASIVNVRGGEVHSFPWTRMRRRRRRIGQLNFLRVRGGRGHNNNDDYNNAFAPHLLHGFGLDKTALELLPTFVYNAEEMQGTLECAVCLEEFEEKETGRLLPKCNHVFHVECIDMWFHSHSTCPLCRTSVKPVKPDNPEEWLDNANPSSSPPLLSHELLIESGIVSTEAEAGSSLSSVSAGASGVMTFAPDSMQESWEEDVAEGEDSSRGWLEEQQEQQQQQQQQASTTTTTTATAAAAAAAGPDKVQEQQNNSSNNAAGAYIPPNVLFWGIQTHLQQNTQSATDAALALENQQQGFPGSVSLSIRASSVAVEMSTRNPAAIAEELAEASSSSSGMALLASLRRMLSRGRIVTPPTPPPPPSPAPSNAAAPPTDLEQGAAAGPSHLPSSP